MQFRGWSGQAAQIWQILIQRFPQNFEYKRQLGVTYLTIGKDESAKKIFEELIHLNGDSFAKAHLGKILQLDVDTCKLIWIQIINKVESTKTIFDELKLNKLINAMETKILLGKKVSTFTL